MAWSFPIAKVKGIEIKVHMTFALVLLWAALNWGVQQQLGWAGAFYGILFVSLLFLCVTLHELGHSLVALHYGATVRDITLLPIGGVARLEGEMSRPAHEFWMTIAGPAVNVVLAIILGAITIPLLGWRAFGGFDMLMGRLSSPSWERLLLDLLVANVGLAIFNLLPAFPMDGGRVLRALLATQMGKLNATRIAMRVGQGLAVLMGVVGVLGGNLNLAIIALFILSGASQEWRMTQLNAVLKQIPASAALIDSGVVLSPTDSLARAIDVSLRTGQADFAVFDGGYLVGLLTREDVAESFQRYGPHVLIQRIMRPDFPVAQAGDSLMDLQAKMKSSGSSVISIIEDQRFLGLATLDSVRNALRMSGPAVAS
ncbi:MAG TPA: site-2 protease family protein [Chloroflexi bacterium]|nr:site-2 protease family protein [Chloroflexota bacterium]